MVVMVGGNPERLRQPQGGSQSKEMNFAA